MVLYYDNDYPQEDYPASETMKQLTPTAKTSHSMYWILYLLLPAPKIRAHPKRRLCSPNGNNSKHSRGNSLS